MFVDQPTKSETIDILHGVKSLYEKHHRVTITDAAVRAAAVMSDHYVADRALPDKAIDLIDEGSARVRLKLTTTPDELKDLQTKIKKLQVEERAPGLRDCRQRARRGDEAQGIRPARQAGRHVPEVDEEDIAQIVRPGQASPSPGWSRRRPHGCSGWKRSCTSAWLARMTRSSSSRRRCRAPVPA